MNTGLGAVVALTGNASWSGRWRSIAPVTETVEALDDTALDASGYKEYVPDDLADIEEIEVEVFWDFAAAKPPTGKVGTLTITFAKQAGQNNAAKITGSGFISGYSKPELAVSQRLIGSIRLRFDGKTGPSYTAAT